MAFYNRGLRGFGAPKYGFYGGLRYIPQMLQRASYTPGEIITVDSRGMEHVTALPPSPTTRKRTGSWPPVTYTRKLPHLEPPAYNAVITYINAHIAVPAGGVIAADLIPSLTTLPNQYVVPLGFRYEAKKFLIVMGDTDYPTLFCNVLRNGVPAFTLQGANAFDGTALDSPAPSGGWDLLPTFPQDQFNTELRFNENDRVGFQVINNTPLIREVHIGLFGWKYLKTVEQEGLGIN